MQLSNFPSGAHDDGIDALAMLVDMADDFSESSPEEMKDVINNMLTSKYDPKKISMIHPISGKTINISNSYGLFRIKKPKE